MSSIDPRPEQVSGLQRGKPYAHNRVIRRYPKDMVATSTHVGYFPQGRLPTDEINPRRYKHTIILAQPHRCSKCGDYMLLRKGSSDRYRCVGKCLDRKAEKYVKNMKDKYSKARHVLITKKQGVIALTDEMIRA